MWQFMRWVTAAPAVAAVFIQFSSRADSTTNAFGFSGPEIYPIDQQIALLHVADLDGELAAGRDRAPVLGLDEHVALDRFGGCGWMGH